MSDSSKEQSAGSFRGYRKWLVALMVMLLGFAGYFFYSTADLTGTCPTTTNQPSAAITADHVVQINADVTAVTVFLGVDARDLDSVLAEQLDIPGGLGVLVNSVVPDSPADTAGLRRGDVIFFLANRPVKDLSSLREIMATLSAGDNVRLGYIRAGRREFVYVELVANSDIVKTAAADTSPPGSDTNWGVSLSALTAQLREQYTIDGDVRGLVILSVTPGSLADQAGLFAGDVITGVGSTDISDQADLFSAIGSVNGDSVALNINSHGQTNFVTLPTLPEDVLDRVIPFSVEGVGQYETLLEIVPYLGIAGLGVALAGYFSLFRYPPGNRKMRAIAEKIRSGTAVFLKQEYKVTAIFLGLFFIIICVQLCAPTALAFMVGSLCSMFPGLIGMKSATTANVRTCQAAKDKGLHKALTVAFKGGAVMGVSVMAVGVIGLGFYCLAVLTGDDPASLPYVIAGFCLGASFFALFGRVGGGIYTKSADIGADMTGKLEFHLPEDDPRNPAVIADNVGDNVGDVAGMGSDLFESFTSATVATIILALTTGGMQYVALPLALAGLGLVCCIIAICLGRFLAKGAEAQVFLRRIIYAANILFLVGAYVVIMVLTGESALFVSVAGGVLCGILIGLETEYFGSGLPVRYIVKMSRTGAATNVISGLAVGFIGAFLPIVTICATIILTLLVAGLYGIGLSAVGMLGTMAIIMSIDAFGPIVDNAGGIATMSGANRAVRRATDKLDVAGNVTAAIGKGFTVGAGVISTVALFAAYIRGTDLAHTELFAPRVLVGLFIGVALPLVFAALTMAAVTRIASKLVIEVRRQFREIKGLLAGTGEPQVDKCIKVVANSSLKAAVLAGSMALAAPFVVFFALGVEAMGGFLVGAMVTGSVLGMSMSIGGVAWDNAKKMIEQRREFEGDMEVAHKSAIVGDMVGDPFKDVSGPAMNILIKLMVTIALVFCTMFCAR